MFNSFKLNSGLRINFNNLFEFILDGELQAGGIALGPVLVSSLAPNHFTAYIDQPVR
jgi:hypothetical protein